MELKIFLSAGRLKVKIILTLLFLSPCVFAAPPIQEKSLRGATAAEARLRLIIAAESYLGTPYRFGGLDRRGVDCSGFVFLSFRDGLQYTVPRTAALLYGWVERINKAELQPADLVFFVTVGYRVSHVGIYIGNGRFIHSASEGPRTGVIISRLDESYWRRTFRGAGRALPGDSYGRRSAGEAQPVTTPAAESAVTPVTRPSWVNSGFFAGVGAAWTWGGLLNGSPSLFRGISAVGSAGYKWTSFRAGLDLRPEWDRALSGFRIPLTLAMGTDTFQVFAGPVLTIRDPVLRHSTGDRFYTQSETWRWEMGSFMAFSPIQFGQGALSLYSEVAWRPYVRANGDSFSFPDTAARLRVSTGLRYLRLIR